MFFYQKLLKSLLEADHRNDEDIAVTMYNLGAILKSLKEYEKAEFYLLSASQLLSKINKYHPFRAIIMDSLAGLGNMEDKHPKKQDYQDIATAIRQRDPSIDYLESYRYRKCRSLSLDMDSCKILLK